MTVTASLILFAAAVLLGTFPTAYVLVRRATGQDLRKEGSGNIGTLNAYEVTRSRTVGIVVLMVDLIKGSIPAVFAARLFPDEVMAGGLAVFGVVLGHNYSPWIGFKGGRGLAAAAGAMLVFNPLVLIYWVLFWLIAFARRRNVHFGNIIASVLAPLLLAFTPKLALMMARFPIEHAWQQPLVASAVCLLILARHAGPLREMLARRSSTSSSST